MEREENMGGPRLHAPRNYSHIQKYGATGWQCQACVLQVREDQDHLSLRQGLDPDTDDDLVEFLRQVMARRERHGWD